MPHILIDSKNTTSPGPASHTIQLVNWLAEQPEILQEYRFTILHPELLTPHLHPSPKVELISWKPFRFLSLSWYNQWQEYRRLINNLAIDGILVAANFLPFAHQAPSVSILRHPYLIDDAQLGRLPQTKQFPELIRRMIFHITAKKVDHLIIQAEHMREPLQKRYGVANHRIHLLPNPLLISTDHDSTLDAAESSNQTIRLIYISRGSPHKNHQFLLDLIEAHRSEFVKRNIRITTTVSKDFNSNLFRKVEAEPLIDNVGEVLVTEVHHLYEDAVLHIFPSNSETYGNPIAESIFRKVPLFMPDLPYGRELAADCAEFYPPGDVDQAGSLLFNVLDDPSKRKRLCENCQKRATEFPNMEHWFLQVLKIMGR